MSKVMDKAIGELHTGSCRFDNYVGVGYFIIYNDFIDETRSIQKEMEGAECYSLTTTDNRMELLAVIYGLESVIDNITSQKIKLDQLHLYTTSKFLNNAVSFGWIYKWKTNEWIQAEWNGNPSRPIKNSDLWKQVIACEEKLRQLGVDLLLHFVPRTANAKYRMECFDKVNQLAYKAAEEVFNMREKYYDELLYELYGDELYSSY